MTCTYFKIKIKHNYIPKVQLDVKTVTYGQPFSQNVACFPSAGKMV